ncbi:peptide chain release factor N(5)-glutamine methyltransferase [Paenibacillus sp. PR3]|uniref:Release factor glutamine methyltransferase n=1 Tax=Paenibacillus terricola TaxID=2763503 RepID=A0ABR8MXP3_9BACL|nr:peptide chain release factor N(5)-glutamine methyltransferase [Paenibacillus terricola]MBD3920741.1 peptide chain release factor N(5)-glutamine methyltransferase [Paenibacillus terricola]
MTQSEVTYRPGMTIGEACLQASSLLAGVGIGEPRSNANLLLCHILGFTKAELLRDWHEPMPEPLFEQWAALIARKAAGEPVQYLIGEGWFYGRPFTVTPAVLIPRPETELLVEAVIEAADKLWPAADKGTVPSVVDVGTGSGAIAVTLSAERTSWRLFASDLSPEALAVASGNAARHEAAERITFVQGDLLLPFVPDGGGVEHQTDAASGLRIDVLVSNPPYIPAADIPSLQPEVRDYEPRLALVGGDDDGLEPYRRMSVQLPQLAQLPRIVGFELGIGQAQDVADLLRAIGHWDEIRIIADYGGIDRHVLAIRHAE